MTSAALAVDGGVAIVLAAGEGRRLWPLTADLAKPALPFFDTTVIGYALDAVAQAGIGRVGINVWYRPESVYAAVADWEATAGKVGKRVPTVTWSLEESLLGTGGGAGHAFELMGSPKGPVCILNGDAVFEVDLGAMISQHVDSGAAVTLCLTPGGEGGIEVDGEGIIRAVPGPDGLVRPGAAGGEASFAGISVWSTAAMSWLPKSAGCLFRQGLACRLATVMGQVRGVWSPGRHWDVGTPSRYWEATQAELIQRAHRTAWLCGDAEIEAGASVGPDVVLGMGARVLSGSYVQQAAIYHAHVSGNIHGVIQVGDRIVRVGRDEG